LTNSRIRRSWQKWDSDRQKDGHSPTIIKK
jgi:hypothetical protein